MTSYKLGIWRWLYILLVKAPSRAENVRLTASCRHRDMLDYKQSKICTWECLQHLYWIPALLTSGPHKCVCYSEFISRAWALEWSVLAPETWLVLSWNNLPNSCELHLRESAVVLAYTSVLNMVMRTKIWHLSILVKTHIIITRGNNQDWPK